MGARHLAAARRPWLRGSSERWRYRRQSGPPQSAESCKHWLVAPHRIAVLCALLMRRSSRQTPTGAPPICWKDRMPHQLGPARRTHERALVGEVFVLFVVTDY